MKGEDGQFKQECSAGCQGLECGPEQENFFLMRNSSIFVKVVLHNGFRGHFAYLSNINVQIKDYLESVTTTTLHLQNYFAHEK